MKYYGTKNNKDFGFYEDKFDNAVEISDEYWIELLDKQNNGHIIILYDGNVIAVKETEYECKNGVWERLTKDEGVAKTKTDLRKINNSKQEILDELEILDKKRIRALAEPSLIDCDTTWLEHYNTKIIALREELSQL